MKIFFVHSCGLCVLLMCPFFYLCWRWYGEQQPEQFFCAVTKRLSSLKFIHRCDMPQVFFSELFLFFASRSFVIMLLITDETIFFFFRVKLNGSKTFLCMQKTKKDLNVMTNVEFQTKWEASARRENVFKFHGKLEGLTSCCEDFSVFWEFYLRFIKFGKNFSKQFKPLCF